MKVTISKLFIFSLLAMAIKSAHSAAALPTGEKSYMERFQSQEDLTQCSLVQIQTEMSFHGMIFSC